MILPAKQTILAAALALSSALPGIAQNSQPSAGQTVRGTVETVSPKTVRLKTRSGEISVAIHEPLTVYRQQPSDLSQVKDSTFVGITSVKQPDGSQVATEVHIFPETLRGTREGSYMMNDASGNHTTNRMTNGNIEAPRMTNGTVSGWSSGETVTVDYGAGSEVITLPSGIKVTAIVPIKGGLAPGENVIVLATKTDSEALVTDKVLLVAPKK